jgi:hypothetical protein
MLTPYPHCKIKESTFSGVSEDFTEMPIFGVKKQEIQENLIYGGGSHHCHSINHECKTDQNDVKTANIVDGN